RRRRAAKAESEKPAPALVAIARRPEPRAHSRFRGEPRGDECADSGTRRQRRAVPIASWILAARPPAVELGDRSPPVEEGESRQIERAAERVDQAIADDQLRVLTLPPDRVAYLPVHADAPEAPGPPHRRDAGKPAAHEGLAVPRGG